MLLRLAGQIVGYHLGVGYYVLYRHFYPLKQ